MPKWGIFNASLLLNEHGHHPFLFRNWSYMTTIQWTKFEQKSIVTFISEELPKLEKISNSYQAYSTKWFISSHNFL